MFPDATHPYESVVSRADSAMYQAKADGRGRFRIDCSRVDVESP
jgi:GGDEF domain-containing protein